MNDVDQVWNRACLPAAGEPLNVGDTHLRAVVLLSSLAQNGGIHGAVDQLRASELDAAQRGFVYLGLPDAAEVVGQAIATSREALGAATDSEADEVDTAVQARYEAVAGESLILDQFKRMYHSRPDDFAQPPMTA